MNGEGERLYSLDALRGFDMFFIIGGATLVSSLCAACGWQDGWLAGQMKHVEWAGLAHHDTIFPLFLFLAGVSWPFSLASQVAKGRSVRQILMRVLKRTAVLFLILVLQIGIMAATSTNSAIHDCLASTVVVDMATQMIFDTEEELLAFKKELHEKEVEAKPY
jgi:predicted acyltransferase